MFYNIFVFEFIYLVNMTSGFVAFVVIFTTISGVDWNFYRYFQRVTHFEVQYSF